MNIASEEVLERESVESHILVCGNCIHYEWADDFDRHHGRCSFQDAEDNPTNSAYFVKGQLHALTGASECSQCWVVKGRK